VARHSSSDFTIFSRGEFDDMVAPLSLAKDIGDS
jgi:hypothetical protein